MFKHQFMLTQKEEIALREICCFIINCYVQAWFSCANTIEAPLNDIIFLKKLVLYKNINKKIADLALKKFCNHLWYLNEECVVFSLFDPRISNEDKRMMAKKLLQEKAVDDEDEIDLPKKLTLKAEEICNFLDRNLPVELLSRNSLKTFTRFNINSDFLKIDSAKWDDNFDYKRGQDIIKSIKVVNDTAERHVKLMKEYNKTITKNEDQKQFLLQV